MYHDAGASKPEIHNFGQLAGDTLGNLIEFQSPEDIHLNYPEGVRELANAAHGTPFPASQRMTRK